MTRISSHFPQRLLMVALAIGLLVRLAVLANTGSLEPKIVDEQQYSQIAENIVAGHGFAWGPGQPTSIRPPLYPALLAGVWAVSPGNLQAVRVLQILLGLATAALVYLLGARIYGPAVGAWAAAVCWLYPSFIFFNFLILTETLFTFLLVAFVLLTVMLVQTPRAWLAVVCADRPRPRRSDAQHSLAAAADSLPAAGRADPRAARAPGRAALPRHGRLRARRSRPGPFATRRCRRAHHRRHDGRHQSSYGQLRVHA